MPPIEATVAIVARDEERLIGGAVRSALAQGAGVEVLVIDDHVLVRVGASRLVDDLPGFSCVGAAADGVTVQEACRSLRPDLLLLDLHLPAPAGMPEQPPGLPGQGWNPARQAEATRAGEAPPGKSQSAASSRPSSH